MNALIKNLKLLSPVLLLALAMGSGQAQAIVIFDATASASLTVGEIRNTDDAGNFANLIISGLADISGQDMSETGNASATADGDVRVEASDPESLIAGDSLVQVASVFGDADSVGNSSAFMFSEGEINIENLSSDSFEIDFVLDYLAEVDVTVENPITESGFAQAFILLVDELFEFDEILVDLSVSASDFDSVEDEFFFTLLVGPEYANTLTLVVEAETDGSSSGEAVAEPSLILLLLTGVFAWPWVRKTHL